MKDFPITKALLFLVLALPLAACSVTPDEYKGETPNMDMRTYFNGQLQAWGLFQNYREKVVNRFHVKMKGTWNDNKGTLEEFFTYSDGSTQTRTWNLVRIDQNNYTGTADDVVGEARGTAYGHALRWKYTLALQVDDETYNVQFDDWMYLIDEHTVINRSVMRKFGIDVGEVILVFRKLSPSNGNLEVNNNTGELPLSQMPLLNQLNQEPTYIL